MRTLRQIEQDLAAAKAAYLAAREQQDVTEATNQSFLLKVLQAEHARVITDGAAPCACGPDGSTLWGMRKRPGVFEVGCLVCGTRARGETPAAAVEAWNAGEYVPAKPEPVLTVAAAADQPAED